MKDSENAKELVYWFIISQIHESIPSPFQKQGICITIALDCSPNDTASLSYSLHRQPPNQITTSQVTVHVVWTKLP